MWFLFQQSIFQSLSTSTCCSIALWIPGAKSPSKMMQNELNVCQGRVTRNGCSSTWCLPRRLFKAGLDQMAAKDPKVSRHELPPLDGPKALPESICKGKGKGKTKKGKGFKKGQRVHSVGHWILLHHTPKLLVRPDSKSSLLWWHPGEHSVWTRGWRGKHIEGLNPFRLCNRLVISCHMCFSFNSSEALVCNSHPSWET